MKNNMTILMPVAKCNNFAREAINHIINNFENNLIVLYDEEKPENYIINDKVTYLKNQFGKNFPKILNQLFQANNEEYGFLCNWRQRPKKENIIFALQKLKDGFGFVDLESPLLCSIYHNDIFSKIGFMDERYIGGHCVDWDIVNSLIYNDIAHYCCPIEKPDYSLSTKDNPTYTTWVGDCGNRENYIKFDIKWKKENNKLVRVMKEKNFKDRNFFETKNYKKNYINSNKSIIEIEWVKEFYKNLN